MNLDATIEPLVCGIVENRSFGTVANTAWSGRNKLKKYIYIYIFPLLRCTGRIVGWHCAVRRRSLSNTSRFPPVEHWSGRAIFPHWLALIFIQCCSKGGKDEQEKLIKRELLRHSRNGRGEPVCMYVLPWCVQVNKHCALSSRKCDLRHKGYLQVAGIPTDSVNLSQNTHKESSGPESVQSNWSCRQKQSWRSRIQLNFSMCGTTRERRQMYSVHQSMIVR